MGNYPLERYHVFGLLVESELALPELITGNLAPDVVVKFGEVTDRLEGQNPSGIYFKSNPQIFSLKVDGVAQYLVENGNAITIDRTEGGSDDEIRLFLLGSAFGALIHQRGILPLHGSAIVVDNQALIFSGISGAGKSTLAAGFLKRGYKLLADDVCVITLDVGGKPIVHPGYPQMKLWSDSLENLGHTGITTQKIRKNIKKYSLPIQAEFHNSPLSVNVIYVISSGHNQSIELETLSGIQKFNTINENTYRLDFLEGSGCTSKHFKHIEAISQCCIVKSLQRPLTGFHIGRLIEVIENDLDVHWLE